MSLRKKAMGGAAHVLSGQLAVQGVQLARSVVLGRMLSPHDIGVAAVFTMTMSFLDLVSNLAADRFLVQAKDGDSERLQATAQSLKLIRGIVCALVMVAVAGPVSTLLGAPQAEWAFYWLALIPLLRGAAHMDPQRLEREYSFAASQRIEAWSQLWSMIAAVPLCWYLGDYSAVLWVLVTQCALDVVFSHVAARRRYVLGWDASDVRRVMAFSWPLMVNGVTLFLVLQGDRFMIGAADQMFDKQSYTLSDLGIYAYAATLALMPTKLVATMSRSLFLPVLSRVQDEPAKFNRRLAVCGEGIALAGTAFSALLIVGGGAILVLLYGEAYAAGAAVIGWLAAAQALRMLRVAPNIAAMARADTKNPMYSNFARVLALIGVFAAAASGWSIVWIAFAGFVGELLAVVVSAALLYSRHGVPIRICVMPMVVLCSAIAVSEVVRVWAASEHGWVLQGVIGAALAGVLGLAALAASPAIRTEGLVILGEIRARRGAAALAGGGTGE